MKKKFYVLVGILLTSCGVPKEPMPESISISTEDEKIAQVKELLAPKEMGKAEVIIDSTGAIIEETPPTLPKLPQTESGNILETLPISPPTVSNNFTGTAVAEDPFTPDEIQIIENTTDAEIDELINIIFSE